MNLQSEYVTWLVQTAHHGEVLQPAKFWSVVSPAEFQEEEHRDYDGSEDEG